MCQWGKGRAHKRTCKINTWRGREGGNRLKTTPEKKKSVIATGIIYVYVSEAICTVYISTVHTCIHTHVWMDERGPCAAVSDGDSIALEPGWSGLKS